MGLCSVIARRQRLGIKEADVRIKNIYRRLIILSIMICLVVVLTSCGSSGGGNFGPGAGGQEGQDYNSGYDEADEDTGDEDYAEEDYEEEEEDSYSDQSEERTYKIEIAHPFSEGRAWAEWDQEDDYHLGIIDTDGNAIYSISNISIAKDFFHKESEGTHTRSMAYTFMPFRDGITYIDFNGHGFIIIDKEGNELSRFVTDDEREYRMLGYQDGEFLVREHVENVEEDQTYIYVIDKNGKKLKDPAAANAGKKNADCLGQGIFQLYNDSGLYKNGIYNSKTGQYVDCEPMVSTVSDGKIIFHGDHGLCLTNLDVLENQENWDKALAAYREKADQSDRVSEGEIRDFPLEKDNIDESSTPYQDGQVPGNDICVYDFEGKALNKPAEIPEKASYPHITNFKDGYAGIFMNGADGEFYFTLVDKEGKKQYDFMQGNIIQNLGRGYLLVHSEENNDYYEGEFVISPTGQILDIGADDISGVGEDARGYKFRDAYLDSAHKEEEIIFSGGFIIGKMVDDNQAYISLDAEKAIVNVTVKGEN